MIQTQRQSKQYNNNLIDYLLTFEPESSWSISSGSGTATRSNLQSYYGTYSLRIVNNTPASAIVATNAVQDYEILEGANFAFALRVLKQNPTEVITGKLNIYQNAVLLAAEAWSIGSATAADDIDGEWATFVSNTYALTKGDNITFTFEIDSNATADPNITVYFDGVQMWKVDRLDRTPPPYSPPVNFNEVLSAKLTVSSAQMQAINTTPLTIISAPGTGLGILLIDAFAVNTFNTTAFDLVDADGLKLGYASSDKAQKSFDRVNFVNASATARIVGANVNDVNNIVSNTAVQVYANDDPASGDGEIVITAYYRVVSVD